MVAVSGARGGFLSSCGAGRPKSGTIAVPSEQMSFSSLCSLFASGQRRSPLLRSYEFQVENEEYSLRLGAPIRPRGQADKRGHLVARKFYVVEW